MESTRKIVVKVHHKIGAKSMMLALYLSADHFTEKELLGRIVVVREFLSTEINPMAFSHHGFSQHAIRFEEINSLIKFNKMCKIV